MNNYELLQNPEKKHSKSRKKGNLLGIYRYCYNADFNVFRTGNNKITEMKYFNWFVSKYFSGEKYYWNGDGFTNDCLSAKFYYDRIDAGKIAKKYDGKVEHMDLI